MKKFLPLLLAALLAFGLCGCAGSDAPDEPEATQVVEEPDYVPAFSDAESAAMASFTGVGEYKQLSDAVKSMSHITYEYVPNKENHEIYRKLYDRVYRKLYDANKKFYKEIREIIKH